ncbi:MAG: hypothetical protein QME46_09600 [Thermoanaerobacteraceae bacterium]|nr:hypothetical protein [Thermoanaerobacteraceae bacterium]
MDGGIMTVVALFVIATGLLYAVFAFLPLMYDEDRERERQDK